MLNFSNLTPAEVLRYAAIEGVPEPLLKLIERMNDEICELEVEAAKAKRQIEIAEEQAYFARELVEAIDNWTTELPKTKQAAYKVIRDNTQFET
jgi:hypothetical protein